MQPTPSAPMPRAAAGRTAVLVLGMHRSGTSALAGALAQLGCAAPVTPMEADEGNARGYFESRRVYELHNAMLAAAGTHWTDWAPLDPAWLASPEARAFRDRAGAVIEAEFGDAALFVLKDPRFCRTAPLWLGALEDRGVAPLALLTHRHPLEIAASLERRNGLDRDTALLLWLRHVLDAEVATRGLARAHTSYDRLLGDWRAAMRGIEDGLGLTLPGDEAGGRVEAFLSGGLRHHEAGPPDPSLPPWVREAHAVAARWAERGEDAEGRATLDGVRAAFDAATPLFAPAAEGWRRERRELADALARSEASAGESAAATEAERARADGLAADLDRRLGELAEAARLVVAMRRKGRQTRDRLAARIEAAGAQADAERRARLQAEASLAGAEAQRRAVLASTSWRLTAPLRAAIDRTRGRGAR